MKREQINKGYTASPIGKSATVDAGRYSYSHETLSDVIKFADSLGIDWQFKIDDKLRVFIDGEQAVELPFIKVGDKVGKSIINGVAVNKYASEQDMGASLSYAKRYGLVTALGLPIDDKEMRTDTVKEDTTVAKVAVAPVAPVVAKPVVAETKPVAKVEVKPVVKPKAVAPVAKAEPKPVVEPVAKPNVIPVVVKPSVVEPVVEETKQTDDTADMFSW